jgi:hypothetical protein
MHLFVDVCGPLGPSLRKRLPSRLPSRCYQSPSGKPAIEGLRHAEWRVRRTSARLLDRVELTAESAAGLTRALDDEHPQVRRQAVRALSCDQCKPRGCVVDVRPVVLRILSG